MIKKYIPYGYVTYTIISLVILVTLFMIPVMFFVFGSAAGIATTVYFMLLWVYPSVYHEQYTTDQLCRNMVHNAFRRIGK